MLRLSWPSATATQSTMTGPAAVEVVVLGGGYVGLWATRSIARGLRAQVARGEVRITLISAMDHHAFHGWTAEVITGDVLPWHARVPISELVPERVRRIHGEVIAADLVSRQVTVRTPDCERQIPYQELVVAVGSRDARDRIPGLREHGWSVKDDGHLGMLNRHLAQVASRAGGADAPSPGPASSWSSQSRRSEASPKAASTKTQ